MYAQLYSQRRVTIMGLGRFGGGVAAARFLAANGAVVSVTDLRSEDELRESVGQLQDVPIVRYAFGKHPDELFQHCDLLVVNPAVPPNHPGVAMAMQNHADVTTEIELFCRHNSAPVIAVTGSNGKSTTTALIHHLLVHAWQSTNRHAWLGGNIGVSLLEQLPQIKSTDRVVLELSSFQLELLRSRRFRPNIAVITNFAANHLDWHGTVDAYRRAKQGILDGQQPGDAAILPELNESGDDWRARGNVYRFGLQDCGEDGGFIEDGILSLRTRLFGDHPSDSDVRPSPLIASSRCDSGSAGHSAGCIEEAIQFWQPSQLPGRHNGRNLAAACCAAWLAGADPNRFQTALKSFVPLPHRLQLVAERAGRRFFNDSIATTPESAMEALNVFSNRLILLAGGFDKGQNLTMLAEKIRRHAAVVVLMGQTAETLEQQILAAAVEGNPIVLRGLDFADCFRMATELSQPGDTILLSPGCASYGWFRDYRERGDLFTILARNWSPEE